MIRSFLASEIIFTSNGEKIIHPFKCIEHREALDWYIDLTASLENQMYLQNDMILVVNTKEKGSQPFRIKNPRITSKVEVRAYHIGFDTLKHSCELSTVINQNCLAAMTSLLTNSEDTNNFTVYSNIGNLKSFSVIDKSLYDGFLQIAEEYNGILDFDGWQIRITSSIGTDRGVVLAYGKNIQESEVNENWDLVVTKLKPIGNDGITLSPEWLTADVSYDRPYTKIMAFDTDDLTNLGLIAQLYLDRYKFPRVNYKVKADVEQNVGLGDSVVVKARQFTITTEVLSFDYNVLSNRVEAIEFGNFRPTLKNYFSEMTQQAEEKAVKRAQIKIDDVDGRITQIVTDVDAIGSQLEQTSNQFSLTFSKTLHEMKNKLVFLDTVHMYGSETGTNLGFTEISVSVPEVYFFSTNQGTNEYYFMPHNEVSLYGLKRGDPYTFSATLISEAVPSTAKPATDVGVSVYYYTDASLPPIFLTGKNFKSIDEETTTALTFTLPINSIGWFMKLEVIWSLSGPYTFMHFHMKNAQLEQGSIATEFSNNMSTISGAKYIFNGENASFFNGGLRIFDKMNNQVLGADVDGKLWVDSLDVNDGLRVNSNDVWHAGNFNPILRSINTGKVFSSINALASDEDAWNLESNSIIKYRNSNNALSIIVGGTLNDRNAIIQVGHGSHGYAGFLGVLHLNLLGGDVTVNGHSIIKRNGGTFDGPVVFNDTVTIGENKELRLRAASGSTDAGDIVWQEGNGSEQHRIWGSTGLVDSLYYRYKGGPARLLWHEGNFNPANYSLASHLHSNLSAGNGLAAMTAYNGGTARTLAIGAGQGIQVNTNDVALINIVAGSGSVGAIKYNATSRLAGSLYGGSTVPSSTVSLNYDGIFWAQGLRFGASGSSSYSDIRMKKDVGSLNYGVDLILSLKPKQFRYKNEFEAPEEVVPSKINAQVPTSRTSNRDRLHYGFIAQDVEKILSKIGIEKSALIKGPNQDSEFYGIDYTQLIAPMIATIQNLEKRIALLEQN